MIFPRARGRTIFRARHPLPSPAPPPPPRVFRFPRPWVGGEGTPSPVGASARARLVSSARGALAAGLAYRATGDAAAAAEALRAASSDAHGWRLAARVATAAARATEYAAPETSRGYYAVAGSIFVARVADVSDPLEVVAESEWAMRGTDSIAAEDARGEVISAAADAVAERFVAAVAALPAGVRRRERINGSTRRDRGGGAKTGGVRGVHGGDGRGRRERRRIPRGGRGVGVALSRRTRDARRRARRRARLARRGIVARRRRRRVGVRGGAVERRRVAPRKRPRALSRELRRHRVALEELVDAMAALAPLGAGAAVRAPLARLADKLDASSDGTVPLAPSATLAATAAARASFIASTLDATRAVAVGGSRAAAAAASSCASEIFSDAMVASAGAAARDALDVGRETPRTARSTRGGSEITRSARWIRSIPTRDGRIPSRD